MSLLPKDEDEGIDVSSMNNEKNKNCLPNGPYVYELFSIMVHAGSASGGHYYAYIKDFRTDEWFCFNDQSVSKVSPKLANWLYIYSIVFIYNNIWYFLH